MRLDRVSALARRRWLTWIEQHTIQCQNIKQSKPDHLLPVGDKVPTTAQILKALRGQCYTYEVDRVFIRAVINPKYISTASPFLPGRFGPAPGMAGADQRLPFTWLYPGDGQPCGRMGRSAGAEQSWSGSGLPHHAAGWKRRGGSRYISFPRPLRLWRLGEDHSSRLGVHDMINEGEYAACNLLGERIREAML